MKDELEKHVEQVWARARSNAFAHRAAADIYQCNARVLFLFQLITGFTSLFLVIILYALIQDPNFLDIENAKGGASTKPLANLPLVFTISSVFQSLYAIGLGVYQNYLGFEEKHNMHRYNQHSYLYLAQRAREIKSPSMDDEKGEALIQDLERDFQVLKVRGEEPSDLHFELGNEVLSSVKNSKFADLQGFGKSKDLFSDEPKSQYVEVDANSKETRGLLRNISYPFAWFHNEIKRFLRYHSCFLLVVSLAGIFLLSMGPVFSILLATQVR